MPSCYLLDPYGEAPNVLKPIKPLNLIMPLNSGDIFFVQSFPTSHMGGSRNYDPFWGPYHDTAPNIQGTQRGTIILTATHMSEDHALNVCGMRSREAISFASCDG